MDWRRQHEQDIKERRGANEAALSRLTTQFDTLDERLDDAESLTSRLSDRQAADNARVNELSATLRDLQASIQAQSGDIKVILSWIEEQRRRDGVAR